MSYCPECGSNLIVAQHKDDCIYAVAKRVEEKSYKRLNVLEHLLVCAQEIRNLAHRTDLPDIADDGGTDHHGTYQSGAWTRFCNAITEAENA